MMFTAHYQSPLGEILLAADEVGQIGRASCRERV